MEAQEVYCTPWSERMIVPCFGVGVQLLMARLSALVTRAEAWLESIDQPTTRRE